MNKFDNEAAKKLARERLSEFLNACQPMTMEEKQQYLVVAGDVLVDMLKEVRG